MLVFELKEFEVVYKEQTNFERLATFYIQCNLDCIK